MAKRQNSKKTLLFGFPGPHLRKLVVHGHCPRVKLKVEFIAFGLGWIYVVDDYCV